MSKGAPGTSQETSESPVNKGIRKFSFSIIFKIDGFLTDNTKTAPTFTGGCRCNLINYSFYLWPIWFPIEQQCYAGTVYRCKGSNKIHAKKLKKYNDT